MSLTLHWQAYFTRLSTSPPRTQDAGIGGRWRDTIAEWVDRQTLAGVQKPITFCVEGNIGAGKSTYLSMISDISGCNEIQVVQEPVELWQDVDGENLLQQFYGDPSRYAFTFQQYVLLTRINRVRPTTMPCASIRGNARRWPHSGGGAGAADAAAAAQLGPAPHRALRLLRSHGLRQGRARAGAALGPGAQGV